jgi:hypothetical protein
MASWYFARQKQKLGPFSWGQLRQLATYGMLQAADFVWEEGSPKWQPAKNVDGLFPREHTSKQYRVTVRGKTYGPYTGDQIRLYLLTNRLQPETPVQADGTTTWSALSTLAEFSPYVPVASVSQAVVLSKTEAVKLSKEEAELYLAGKEGDSLARLIARLMELKRRYASSATLIESLDKSINDLMVLREQGAVLGSS